MTTVLNTLQNIITLPQLFSVIWVFFECICVRGELLLFGYSCTGKVHREIGMEKSDYGSTQHTTAFLKTSTTVYVCVLSAI